MYCSKCRVQMSSQERAMYIDRCEICFSEAQGRSSKKPTIRSHWKRKSNKSSRRK